jgi:hypothetical protein
MTEDLLLAEEWALAVISAKFGGDRLFHDRGNICVAGLLIAELIVDGFVRAGNRENTIVRVEGTAPRSASLASAAMVIDDYGPKITAVLSQMLRAFPRTPRRPWDAALMGLVEAGVIARPGVGSYPSVIDSSSHEVVVSQLRAAVSGYQPFDTRVALLLGISQAAGLLALVGPEGKTRGARNRAQHVLDGSPFDPIVKAIRRQIFVLSLAKGGSGT